MSTLSRERIVFEEDLPGGAKWSHVLRRHQGLRITDPLGGANVSALFYNRDLLLERYNMPDTLKAQYTAFLTTGRVLFSDMGRILCSVTEDTSGWHDTVCGHTNAAVVTAKYGNKGYQEHRNEWHQNAHDNFLIELGKWGLGKEDIVPNVNFFSKVVTNEAGALHFVTDHAKKGAHVDLRAEMNVLVVLTACQHPLDPRREYAPRPVKLTVFRSDPPEPNDACHTSRAENARGFENTARFFA